MESASFLTGWLVAAHEVLIRRLIIVLVVVLLVIARTLVSDIEVDYLLTILVFFWQVLQSPLDVLISLLLFDFV